MVIARGTMTFFNYIQITVISRRKLKLKLKVWCPSSKFLFAKAFLLPVFQMTLPMKKLNCFLRAVGTEVLWRRLPMYPSVIKLSSCFKK